MFAISGQHSELDMVNTPSVFWNEGIVHPLWKPKFWCRVRRVYCSCTRSHIPHQSHPWIRHDDNLYCRELKFGSSHIILVSYVPVGVFVISRVWVGDSRRVLDWILYLSTTFTHNLEIQVITAPSLISTLYKSP
jgi:hypothetical protein